MTAWLNKIPELGSSYDERGRAIEAAKERARELLAEAIQAEANLFVEIYRSGEWTHEELVAACQTGGMESEVAQQVPFLPRQKRRKAA